MMKQGKALILVLMLMILSSVSLIYGEIKSPGTCPSYFSTTLPACIVMEVYFIIMLAAHLLKTKYSHHVFYFFAAIALLSASIFSIKEIMNIDHCPRMFDIPFPLCFGAWFLIVTALILKFKNRKNEL